ncbi:MAG TPA: TetR/AcrR family transcriptional regulator, partial [Burkholderiales bacterium]|nr:TetR/AcrR family transcriptional regulator [Burkholderiales bacterium]
MQAILPGTAPALRAPGSPAMRKPKDPVANRARILRAAIDEFASRGFKGASMDAIAARTRTTRAMINYYFGSKEKVYVAVLEHVYAQIRQAESQLDLDHLPPVEAIRRIVQFTFDYYLANEGFVRLVVAENQARGRHLKKSGAMRSLNRPIIDTLGRVIERGRTEGAFRDGADPVEVHMTIAALGMFNVTNQYTFGAI